eukprot:181158-Amphidinium_carterae.1
MIDIVHPGGSRRSSHMRAGFKSEKVPVSVGLSDEFAPERILKASFERLSEVKKQYEKVALTLKESKERIQEKEATVWGAHLSSSRREVRGDLQKMKALVFLTVEVIKSKRITTHLMQKVVGYWVHHLLFQRLGLCVLHETYRWLERGAEALHTPRQLPDCVRQELQGFVMLFPLLRADLSSCICPVLYATDATQEIGAVIRAEMCVEDAVFAWTRRSVRISPITMVLQAHQLYEVQREERKDKFWESLIGRQDFHLVTKYRFRSGAHINVKELLAARTALRHVTSDPKYWHTRAIVAIDSQVVVHCLKKGRSSSKAINQILQTMLGEVLSTSVRLVPIWVATECNPADAPTRRRKIPGPQVASEAFFCRRELAMETEPWTLAINQHEWQMRFDQTRGFPGEGPSGCRAKMILGPVKEKEVLKDLRVGVQPATIKRYKAKYDLWCAWLSQEGLPCASQIVSSPALDSVMGAFVQHLYNKDYPISYGLETLAGLQ